MPSVNVLVESKIEHTTRVKQLSAMFDAPLEDVSSLSWRGDVPFDGMDWSIGLIVGPSGSGKTTVARNLFGDQPDIKWGTGAVIDDFRRDIGINEISEICQSVGFNTIPAWMRPYSVLSNGEKFRVDVARRLLEFESPIVVDEFTSVVDRQIAQVGSHAIQKAIRKTNKKFVAISCHYDIVEWLQPDWILEPGTMTFQVRLQRRRPEIQIEIQRVDYSAWKLFAPFHYMTKELNRAAACFVLFANGRPATFCGVLHRPHAKVDDIKGISRIVTLPDWQGLGLAMVMSDELGAAYRSIGKRLHMYPAHPSFIRSYDKSKNWHMEKRPGVFSELEGRTTSIRGGFGGRPCAVFSYCGPVANVEDSKRFLEVAP